MRSVSSILLCLLLTGILAGSLGLTIANAQDRTQTVEQFRVQHFTTVDGLPSNMDRPGSH